jgi:hypothetical protein
MDDLKLSRLQDWITAGIGLKVYIVSGKWMSNLSIRYLRGLVRGRFGLDDVDLE